MHNSTKAPVVETHLSIIAICYDVIYSFPFEVLKTMILTCYKIE